mmetsp:Transcript_118563/g.342845  ORF Transcript_118563/g.342845 Transcript_118563/m.342845 type:complete len:216 (+) Transcript_118563:591-1238(+)
MRLFATCPVWAGVLVQGAAVPARRCDDVHRCRPSTRISEAGGGTTGHELGRIGSPIPLVHADETAAVCAAINPPVHLLGVSVTLLARRRPHAARGVGFARRLETRAGRARRCAVVPVVRLVAQVVKKLAGDHSAISARVLTARVIAALPEGLCSCGGARRSIALLGFRKSLALQVFPLAERLVVGSREVLPCCIRTRHWNENLETEGKFTSAASD